MEERIQKAVGLFKQGFNCSQSVCAAFADLYGYTPEQALKCRLPSEEVSAVCANRELPRHVILAGLQTGTADPSDPGR